MNKDKLNEDFSNETSFADDELKEKWGINYTKYINKIRMAVNETSMEYLEYDGKVISAPSNRNISVDK